MYIISKKNFIYSLFLISFFLLSSCAENKITSLQTEYTTEPLGIDVIQPRFSWQMESTENGQSQIAYQVVVTDETQKEVWNTGKINSNISVNIKYEGKTLQAQTRYQWMVTVWNQDNTPLTSSSWFETGLMNSSIEAWDGAKWIGGNDNDLVLYPNYLPAYNINFDIQLNKESATTRAAFIYGANDPRLMNKDMNIYNLQNAENESYISVELNIAPLETGANALINIYRVGYAPDDKKDIPLVNLSIPKSVINQTNKYDKHFIHLKTMYSNTDVYVGGQDEIHKVGSVVINPIGNSWDYICFPLLCQIGFSTEANQKASFSNLEVRNYRVPNNILFSEDLEDIDIKSVFEKKNGLKIHKDAYQIDGEGAPTFIVADINKKSAPMLRTVFSSKGSKIAKARLYITARGIYNVYMNGKKINNDYFNPGLTQYNKTHFYQTYDVTKHIQNGANAMGVTLSEGWWSGAITYMGYLWNLFGDRQSILSKLVITYTDGTEEILVSNPDTWSYFDDGAVVYSSFFQGEVYDARKEKFTDGWTTIHYNDSVWKKATEINQENSIIYDKDIEINRMPHVNNFSDMQLIGQYGQTVTKVDELKAISVDEVRPGVYVYDMGQNMVGIPKINLSNMKEGKQINLRFAEVKYPDLPEFKDNVGMIMLENIRGALAQDIYITKGGDETIRPQFTFHGYRFVEITGIDKALPLESVKGEVLSSIDQLASSYETSNPKVNKLWKNITWSTRANFLSIPTDCPQRNERMGWSGDISVFSRTATYMAYIPQFLRRHMQAMRDTQREDGRFADVAPIGGGFGGILWGSAGITVPWESYLQYNDADMLAEHYESMKAYINYLKTYIDPNTDILTEGLLGDWLGPEQEKNDNTLLWEAYYIYDLELMHRIANILGKTNDVKYFADMHQDRKSFFNKTYFNHDTGQTIHSGFGNQERKGEVIGTQTSYIIPLAFNICNSEKLKEKVINNLITSIKKESSPQNDKVYPPYSLMTGFIGTAWINRVLSDLEYTDTAYRILQQTTYPSWLYSVEEGATTIWERLNSYTRENGFSGNNSMNSFNHYSFGAIGSWMYNYSLGIERDEEHPGFKHFILKPQPDPSKRMTYAKGHYNSMYGRIESSWEMKDKGYNYRFKVPANTTATLYLEASQESKIILNNMLLEQSELVKIIKKEEDKVIIDLPSGEYFFEVEK